MVMERQLPTANNEQRIHKKYENIHRTRKQDSKPKDSYSKFEKNVIKNHCFILQAVACYLPKFIWDKFEGGLLRTIVMGLNIAICPEGEKQAKKGAILDYITKHIKVMY